MRFTKSVIVAIAGIALSAGVAYAAATTWGEYRVDLIRCADAASICGSASTGTDPLGSGRITLDTKSAALRLRGAQPSTAYRLIFVELKNTGTSAGGPFAPILPATAIGTVTTDKHGNAGVTFAKEASINPRLGFFYVSRAPETGIPTMYEFITGIDQLDPAPVK